MSRFALAGRGLSSRSPFLFALIFSAVLTLPAVAKGGRGSYGGGSRSYGGSSRSSYGGFGGSSRSSSYGSSNRSSYGGYGSSNRSSYGSSSRSNYGGYGSSNRSSYGSSNRSNYGGYGSSNRSSYGSSNRSSYGGTSNRSNTGSTYGANRGSNSGYTPRQSTPKPSTPAAPRSSNNGSGWFGSRSGGSTTPAKPKIAPPQPASNGGYKRTTTKDGGYIEDRGNHVIKYRADGSKEYMKSDSRVVQYRKDGSKAQETNFRTGSVVDHHKEGGVSVNRPAQNNGGSNNRSSFNSGFNSRNRGGFSGNGGGYKRTTTNDGGYIEDRGNHIVKYRADGTREYMKSDARVVQYRKDGSKAQETNFRTGTVIDHHLDGSRMITRRNGVSYTQRMYQQNGITRMQRTYSRNHVTYVRNYNTYVWGGYTYHTYVPYLTYDPWYYSYLYQPWYDPYAYTWSWVSDPWYRYYHYYYTPYPVYYGPSYWLTDFLIADLLASSYQTAVASHQTTAAANSADQAAANADAARRAADDAQAAAANAQAAAQQANQPPVITNEIKDQIKAQVDEAIRAHEKKETIPLTDVLADTKHLFAVTDDIDALIVDTDKNCLLSEGDLVRLAEVPATGAVAATMVVVTSKAGDCKAGSKVTISMSDLQDFQNDFVEKLEEGMEKMKKEVVDKKK